MKLAPNQRQILTGSVIHFADGQTVQVDQTPVQVRELLEPRTEDLVEFALGGEAVFVAGDRAVKAIVPTFDYVFESEES